MYYSMYKINITVKSVKKYIKKCNTIMLEINITCHWYFSPI